MEVGLLKGADLSVDSTQISADASPDRAISRDQLVEVAKVNRTVREYVEQIERENVIPEPVQTSDPSSEATDEPKLCRTYRNSCLFAKHPVCLRVVVPLCSSGSSGQYERGENRSS